MQRPGGWRERLDRPVTVLWCSWLEVCTVFALQKGLVTAKYAKMAVALSCLTVRTRQRAGEEGNYGFSLKKEKKAENYPR